MLKPLKDDFQFQPTELNIQTRTIVAQLHDERGRKVKVDSKLLFWTLPITDPIQAICYGQIRRKQDGTFETIKSLRRKKRRKYEHRNKSKSFGHGRQCTVEIHLSDCRINMKIFQTTGSIQMTGCKRTEIARQACDVVCHRLNRLICLTTMWSQVTKQCLPGAKCPVLWNSASVTFSDFQLCGMKSGWNFNMVIDLSDLDRILQKEYGLQTNYDPNASKRGFHGIKVTLYWNDQKDGICRCMMSSNNRKCSCLRMFVTTFRTGSAGMMGGAATDQDIDEIYRFYTRIIEENCNRIRVLNRTDELLSRFRFRKLLYCNRAGKIVRIRTIPIPIPIPKK